GKAHRRGDLLGDRPVRGDRRSQDLALRHPADRGVTLNAPRSVPLRRRRSRPSRIAFATTGGVFSQAPLVHLWAVDYLSNHASPQVQFAETELTHDLLFTQEIPAARGLFLY